jgi:phage tail-like protein
MKQSEIERLLPGIFQRTLTPDNALYALLGVMEAMHAPDEAILDNIETNFNPYLAKPRFAAFLADWVGLAPIMIMTKEGETGEIRSLPSGMGQLRELVLRMGYLTRWRGTSNGIKLFLEIATGIPGFEIHDTDSNRPFHLRVLAPKQAEPYRSFIQRIVELEKPAHITFDGPEFQ